MAILEEVDKSPVDAFLLLRNLDYPFILSGGDVARQGRFTFIGADPFTVLKTGSADPFKEASKILSEYRNPEPGPFPFNGGGVGYFSYGLKNIIEEKFYGHIEKKGEPASSVPLCLVGFYDIVFVYDHLKGKGYLVRQDIPDAKDGKKRFEKMKKLLAGPGKPKIFPEGPAGLAFQSNLTKEGYIRIVEKALDYITAGDIYQINLSQRLKIPWQNDPFSLYLALLEKSPGRFASFMDCEAFQIISNSPERFLKVAGNMVTTEPIKGTRPRGKTPQEDLSLMEELKKSPKEKAEHLMIVDLERNDLGKVCLPGTVTVTDFERIETYQSIHHMVSTIRGRLAQGIDAGAALRACFPGGSITGAPKIRAMEIIDELETAPRGIYTGCMGWMDFGGDMDMSMAIRTAIHKDKTLWLNVGGGIVADSKPEEEYAETILKAKDFLRIVLEEGPQSHRAAP